MEHKLDLLLEASPCELEFMVNTVLSAFVVLISIFVKKVATGFEYQKAILRSDGNFPPICWSIDEVPNSMST